jgi:uncharacterized protein YjbI with pentapeptide repeats
MPPPSDWLSWEFWAKDSQGLYHLALIIAGAIGIPLLYVRTLAAHRQARTAEQGHITDRFTKAVEQLGSEKMAVRLGAIYALERISKDSRRDHWTIMETLTAYVRERAPWPSRQALANPFVELQGSSAGETAGKNTPADKPKNEAEPESSQVRPATDIQAIFTVLGRRDAKARKQDEAAKRYLNLTRTDLRGAKLLPGARLKGADLRGAHLEGADLRGAHLKDANLLNAHLQGAALGRAHLLRAFLKSTNFEGALLQHAYLKDALLDHAYLKGAYLREAYLKGAGLSYAHLEGAKLPHAHLKSTILSYAHLEGADLSYAHLDALFEGAHLEGAVFMEAHLEGADLNGAIGLTQANLEWAFGDDRTVLPADLTRPAHWSAAPSLDTSDNAK